MIMAEACHSNCVFKQALVSAWLYIIRFPSSSFHGCRRNGGWLQALDGSLDSPLKCADTMSKFGLCETWRCKSASQSLNIGPSYMRRYMRRTSRTISPSIQITNIRWRERVRAAGFADCSCYCPACTSAVHI